MCVWTPEPYVARPAKIIAIHLHHEGDTEIMEPLGFLGFDSRRGLRIFLFTTASRTALGPTQPPIQWVTGALSLGGKSGWGVRLTTHLHLLPRSVMRGTMPPLPNTPSWRGAQLKAKGQLCLHLLY
jgi:hypothetical protein